MSKSHWTRRERFEKQMLAEVSWAEEHHSKVRFDGYYRGVCSCGWIGEARDSRDLATKDLEKHP